MNSVTNLQLESAAAFMFHLGDFLSDQGTERITIKRSTETERFETLCNGSQRTVCTGKLECLNLAADFMLKFGAMLLNHSVSKIVIERDPDTKMLSFASVNETVQEVPGKDSQAAVDSDFYVFPSDETKTLTVCPVDEKSNMIRLSRDRAQVLADIILQQIKKW